MGVSVGLSVGVSVGLSVQVNEVVLQVVAVSVVDRAKPQGLDCIFYTTDLVPCTLGGHVCDLSCFCDSQFDADLAG